MDSASQSPLGQWAETGHWSPWTLDTGKGWKRYLTKSYLRWLSNILQIVSYSRSIAWKEHQVSFVKKINREKYFLVSCIVLAALQHLQDPFWILLSSPIKLSWFARKSWSSSTLSSQRQICEIPADRVKAIRQSTSETQSKHDPLTLLQF